MEENIDNEETTSVSDEENARHLVAAYNKEVEEKYRRRLAARSLNIQPKRPEESSFSKLDSSLKKNTAFVRKIKNFSASQLPALLKDLTALNLTKYVTEIASAITEARLKTADISGACEISGGLHRLYAEFEPSLLDCWKKALTQRTDDSKFRMDLRLFSESILCGLFGAKGLQILGPILHSLVHDHNNANHVLTFCRGFGDEFAGLVPREIYDASTKYNIPIFNLTVIPIEKHKAARSLFHDYYESFSRHLLQCHAEVQKFEKHNRGILQTKGELSSNRKTEYNELLIEYNKLVDTTKQLSEVLNLPMPDLPCPEKQSTTETTLEDLLQGSEERSYGIWEDEETQKFYEGLPNLHDYVPHLVPVEPAPLVDGPSEVTEEQLDLDVELPAETEEEKKEEVVEVETDSKSRYMLSDFITQLPGCCNRDTVDSMAIDFLLNLNTKHNRKKLARGLFAVNRTRLDLLPFYSRLVAIIHPASPDISGELCHLLKADFIYHVRKKDQINIETKIKVVRFIGELVKFRLYSKLEALYCVKVLLSDFHHHHIEMLCNLFETCGRFLYSQTDSHQRMKVYLEQMMRKKSAMAMDSRYVMMIENALFAVVPREGSLTAVKERPPIHEFIRRLLYQDPNLINNAGSVLKTLLKVDWKDPELSAYVIKCLTNAWNVKYFHIKKLACIVSDLARYNDDIQVQVVDGVIEDIRVCLENPLLKYNQRRIVMVKYLGELYYYHMIGTSDLFKTFYLLISLGVTLDHSAPSPLDPPDHVFRLKLVCILLDCVASYLCSGSAKKTLDYFLVFFQNYYWFKRSDPFWTVENPFPMRVQLLVRDTIVNARNKMIIFQTAEEAAEAVDELRADFLAKVGTTEQVDQAGQLNRIDEEDDSSGEEMDSTSLTQSQSQGDDISILQNDGEENGAMVDSKSLECPEDDDFMSAFDKIVAGEMQDRKDRAIPTQVDISVPVHVRSSAKKTYDQLSVPQREKSSVSFLLMLRKGSKQTYKNLSVPVTSELAMNLKQQELAAKMEMEKVKRLTLDTYERLEEEDYQDMMSQSSRPAVTNFNRERKQKYQHPKGAPDADLIFGTGKGK